MIVSEIYNNTEHQSIYLQDINHYRINSFKDNTRGSFGESTLIDD